MRSFGITLFSITTGYRDSFNFSIIYSAGKKCSSSDTEIIRKMEITLNIRSAELKEFIKMCITADMKMDNLLEHKFISPRDQKRTTSTLHL